MKHEQPAIDVRKIAADIGVHLSDKTVRQLEKRAKKTPGSGDWRIWMKNRLSERGFLRPGRRGVQEPTLYVLLHVFNIHRADILVPEGFFRTSSRVARSAIITGHRVPRPIDKVAARVAPGAPMSVEELSRQF